MSSTNNNEKINDILKKIEREKKLADGANILKKNTNNPSVIQKCNIQVREAQKNIEYFESVLAKLHKLSINSNGQSDAVKDTDDSNTNDKQKSYNQLKQRPLFTALDLLKYDCPSLGHKIQYMMQLLEFKIQVETQYKNANEKMANLYRVDGDRSSIALANRGKIESDRKLQLLKKALKGYQSMYIDFDDISRENAMINTVRKTPLTGDLFIQIHSIKNVDHIQSPLFSRNPECIISVKVDDNERAKTKGSRNDKWADFFDIKVEKANEVSLVIYDKVNDELIPVGLFWLSLSDVVEEIRRTKVNQERVTSAHWINASNIDDAIGSGNSTSTLLNSVPALSSSNTTHSPAMNPISASSTASGADNSPIRTTNWYVVEPVGEILLTIGFTKTTESKTRIDNNFTNGLGRHGAIRQRKEEIVESQGHKFVQKQFYNIMTCAVCSEFLRYTGYQCEDCLFLCHQKCIKNVIAKCLLRSSSDISPDDNKLNHRIPHRFIPVANRGAKWCCHCGYLLPFGKKNVRKCEECGIMCHANCVHNVPDLCGISPKTLEMILDALRASQQKSSKSSLKTNKPIASSSTKLTKQKTPSEFIAPPPEEQKSNNVSPIQLTSVLSRTSQKTDEDFTQFDNTYDNLEISPIKTNVEPILEQIETNNQVEVTSSVESPERIAKIPTYHEGSKSAPAESLNESLITPSNPPHPHHHNHRHHTTRQKRRHRRKYGLDDYRFLSVLGKGNFGKVMLAEYVTTEKLCAIKVLKKDFIVENDEVESTKSEKRVFLVANKYKHPFLLNLYQSFQTENRIYFVMEYICGGDLMWHVQQKKFSLRRAQFYASEILLALKFLHDNGIIYRDLKLDNIMLTLDGHIKLADYGLCKEEMWYGNTTRTFCGTPELMAPEIISGEQIYDKAVDWWAFGVLLYQMILSKTPFKGDDEEEVFNAILTDDPLYPVSMSRESVDIIQKLLTRDPKMRLGSGKRDALDIMEHPYFEDVNFEDVLALKVEAPYVPNVEDPRSAKCFEEEFTSQAAKLTPVNSVLTPSDQEKFRGFTYSIDDN